MNFEQSLSNKAELNAVLNSEKMRDEGAVFTKRVPFVTKGFMFMSPHKPDHLLFPFKSRTTLLSPHGTPRVVQSVAIRQNQLKTS